MLAGINQLLLDAGVNVVGQALSTRGERGYVVTDTDVGDPRGRARRAAPVPAHRVAAHLDVLTPEPADRRRLSDHSSYERRGSDDRIGG